MLKGTALSALRRWKYNALNSFQQIVFSYRNRYIRTVLAFHEVVPIDRQAGVRRYHLISNCSDKNIPGFIHRSPATHKFSIDGAHKSDHAGILAEGMTGVNFQHKI